MKKIIFSLAIVSTLLQSFSCNNHVSKALSRFSPIETIHYNVAVGDTFSDIAERFGVSFTSLQIANPGILDIYSLFPGQSITIPARPLKRDTMAFKSTIRKRSAREINSTDFKFQKRSVNKKYRLQKRAIYYTVVEGDTLQDIADRFDLSVPLLQAANPSIVNSDDIFIGQSIVIPNKKPIIHTTVSGDTFYKIANQYQINVKQLREANPQIVNIDALDVGLLVNIPTNKRGRLQKRGYVHYVKSGETMMKIANMYGITYAALKAANSYIVDFDTVYAGQPVNIPSPATKCEMYIIEVGDSFWDLSIKLNIDFETLKSLNPGMDYDSIYPGQVICVGY